MPKISADNIAGHNAAGLPHHEADLDGLQAHLARRGIDAEAMIAEVARFSVAAPSWAVGTGGTRFGRFPVDVVHGKCCVGITEPNAGCHLAGIPNEPGVP